MNHSTIKWLNMGSLTEAISRFTTRRRGWDFQFRTEDGDLWWSRPNLEDANEYFKTLVSGPFCAKDEADLTEFSRAAVAVMLSYFDRYTSPVPVEDVVEYLEELIVLADRYQVGSLMEAVAKELGTRRHSEYSHLATKYGVKQSADTDDESSAATFIPPDLGADTDDDLPDAGFSDDDLPDANLP